MNKHVAMLLAVASVSTASTMAGAQSAPPATSPAAPSATTPTSADPNAANMDEARKHYERGLQLTNEENYEAALVEMERAYQLAPSYRIQYNLGRIHRQLNNYSAALRSYETYLQEGGANIPSERRAEVEKDLAVLKSRIASIEVVTNVPGADVSIDDVPVGKTPLTRTVVVNPGRRRVSATKPGYAPAAQVVTVAGTDALVVRLDLVDLRRPAERPIDYGPRNRALVGWGITGALTITSVVMGVVALNANDKLSTARQQFGANPDDLESQSKKVSTFSALCDGFTVASLIGAGVSTYLTVKAFQANPPAEKSEKAAARSPEVGLSVGLGYVGLRGSL